MRRSASSLPTMDSESEAIALDLGANDRCLDQVPTRKNWRCACDGCCGANSGEDRLRATVEDGLASGDDRPADRPSQPPLRDGAARPTTGRAGEARRSFAVMVIDLDRFKSVNDIFGHAAGDAVLVEVARRLKAATCGASDLLARIGGEEFLVALPDTGAERGPDRGRTSVPRHRGDARSSSTTAGQVSVTISIGVASALPATASAPMPSPA